MQTATTRGHQRFLLVIGCMMAGLLTGCQAPSPQPDTSLSPPVAASTQSAVPAPPAPTVASSSPAAAERVTVRDPATIAKGVELQIRSVRALDVQAQVPGEISGPGIAVRVEIRNNTRGTIDASAIQVNCLDANGSVCAPNRADPARAPRTNLKAGSRTTGVFVFTIARKYRNPVHIEVDLGPTYRSVEFVGRIR